MSVPGWAWSVSERFIPWGTKLCSGTSHVARGTEKDVLSDRSTDHTMHNSSVTYSLEPSKALQNAALDCCIMLHPFSSFDIQWGIWGLDNGWQGFLEGFMHVDWDLYPLELEAEWETSAGVTYFSLGSRKVLGSEADRHTGWDSVQTRKASIDSMIVPWVWYLPNYCRLWKFWWLLLEFVTTLGQNSVCCRNS